MLNSAGLIAAALALVLTGSASAYSTRSTGRPGGLSAMKLVGYDYAGQAPFVAWPAGIVYRSPAAADRLQVICVREYIFDWNYTSGSWYIWDSWPEGRQNCFTAS